MYIGCVWCTKLHKGRAYDAYTVHDESVPRLPI